MLTRLKGGRIVDPANGTDAVSDLWFRDGRVVAAPPEGTPADATHDATGRIVMAGAIDIHTHVAGGNVNTARLLLPEQHRAAVARRLAMPFSTAKWSTYETGRRYAEMGFTTLVEPAVAPVGALHAHLELADIPIVDRAGLAVLGNDDVLLSLLRDRQGPAAVADYVALTLEQTRCLGIKAINAGGCETFKENVRTFSLDDVVPAYGVTSRDIVKALQRAVADLKVPHPLHVHCNNLGVAGNVASALATIEAAEDLPLHLAHIQFYGYGSDGRRGFSSAAGRLAEAVNGRRNVTVDIGQVMFGQTVTVSSDVLRQFEARRFARPNKWVVWDGDGNGGGIVPYAYSQSDYYNVVQWAVGLELFLLIDDPWRALFSTDHPNGAPFTRYPELFHLLMDRDERRRFIATLPAAALETSLLPGLAREYTLTEIAIMTRAAPARLLGLADRGHLGPGAVADIAVYADTPDRTAMFSAARLVFKDGELMVRDGTALGYRWGKTLHLRPGYDSAIRRRVQAHLDRSYALPLDSFAVPAELMGRSGLFEEQPCAA